MYIAIGRYGWGRGTSKRSAVRNMNNNVAADFKNKYILFYTADLGARVDGMGNIYSSTEVTEVERSGADWLAASNGSGTASV